MFADPVLEAMVRGAIGKPEGAITVEEAESVTKLDVGFEWRQYVSEATPIEDISGLEHFKNLESLDLSLNEITDITPLASLTKLTLLVLNGNPVTDIAPLAGLTALKVLALSNCAAQDYSPLANLKGLELLMLNNSTITDATPLASLTNLKRLYLEGCMLDYSPLADIYSTLEDKDFVIVPKPSTLAEFGFYMDGERKQAIYDNEQVSVRINHIEWGAPSDEWGQNCVRVVFGTDEYKVDIGYYPEYDTFVVMAFKNGEFVLNYLFQSDGTFGFSVGDRENSERYVRELFPDAADDEDILLQRFRVLAAHGTSTSATAPGQTPTPSSAVTSAAAASSPRSSLPMCWARSGTITARSGLSALCITTTAPNGFSASRTTTAGALGFRYEIKRSGSAAFKREGGFIIYNFTGGYNNEGFLG